jgi:hypothetical protein
MLKNMNKAKPALTRFQSESGAVLVMGAFLAVLGLMLGTLLIDISLAERALSRHQVYLDAAALSGAMQFHLNSQEVNESLDGWRAAKVAVFESLNRNIPSIPNNPGADNSASCADGTSYEDFDSCWAQITYNFPSYTLEIQRGIYWQAEESGAIFLAFVSLEEQDRVGEDQQTLPACDVTHPNSAASRIGDMFDSCDNNQSPPYLFANAVRLVLTIGTTQAPLASRIFGFDAFRDLLSRDTISSRSIARTD